MRGTVLGVLGLACLGLLLGMVLLYVSPPQPRPGPAHSDSSVLIQADTTAGEPDHRVTGSSIRVALDLCGPLIDLIPKLQGFRIRIVAAEDGRPLPGAAAAWMLHDPHGEASIRLHHELDSPGREPVDEAFHTGQATHADLEGWITVPLLPWTILVSARHADRAGSAFFAPGGPNPARLALEPTRELDIQVVDEHGVPQAGVPVLLRDGKGLTRWRGLSAGPLGKAVARIPRQPPWEDLASRELYAGFQFPIADDRPLAPIDYEKLKPVRLVLPPFGRLSVRLLDTQGRPIQRQTKVNLSKTGFHESCVEARTRAGEVVFPFVGLSREWRLEARIADKSLFWEDRVIQGPALPGAEVRVDLWAEEDWARSVSCRVVDRLGAPLAGALIRVQLDYICEAGAICWSDDTLSIAGPDGRLNVSVCAQPGIARIEFGFTWWRHTSLTGQPLGPWGLATLAVPLAPGVPDLGAVILAGELPFLSGVVLNHQKEPIEGAYVELQAHPPGRRRAIGETANDDWHTTTDANGFFFLTVHDPGPWVVHVGKFGAGMTSSGPFLSGQQGVVLQLDYNESWTDPLGSIEFDLLVDRDLPDAKLTIDVAPERQTRGLGVRFADRPVRTAPDRFTYKTSGFLGRPLAFAVKACGVTLATVEGTPGGPGMVSHDSRIPPIDLRGRLKLLRLQVETPRGPLTDSLRCAVQVQEQVIGLDRYEGTPAGRFEILIPSRAQAIHVGAWGYRPVEVLWSPEEQRVALLPGPLVKLPRIPPWLATGPDRDEHEIFLEWSLISPHPRSSLVQRRILSSCGAASSWPLSDHERWVRLPVPGVYRFALFANRSTVEISHFPHFQGTPFEILIEESGPSMALELALDDSRFQELQRKILMDHRRP